MSIRRPLALALALVAAFIATSAEARCKRAGYRFGPGVPETTTSWRVQAGTTCTSALRPGTVFLLGLAIASPSQHGVAGTGSRYQYAYNPRPGFVGRDRFVLRIDYDFRGARGATRVNVDVDVVPKL